MSHSIPDFLNGCTLLWTGRSTTLVQTAHIMPLKQTLSHGLVQKKVHKITEFNQKAQLKPYIDMSTELRKKGKK